MIKQEQLDKEMIKLGEEAYLRDFDKKVSKGNLSNTNEGKRLISSTVSKVVDAIDEFKKEYSKRRAGNQSLAFKLINPIDNKVLAAISLTTALDVIGANSSAANIYKNIGDEIFNHIRLSEYKRQFPEDFKMALEYSKKSGANHKRTFLTLCFNKHGTIDKWSKNDMLSVGATLFDILNDTLRFFDITKVLKHNSKKSQNRLTIRQELLDYLEKARNHNASLNTLYMPLVQKPARWSNDSAGGYSADVPNYDLVSNVGTKKSNEILQNAPTDVLESLNILQDTAWKINTKVLDKVNECLDRGVSVGKKMGEAKLIPLPEKPEDIEYNEPARRSYRAEVQAIIKLNIKSTSKRYNLLRTLNLAEKFKDEPAIYFPYNLDFRGRVYPKSLFLHPQSTDVIKSLLVFAEGEAIETEDQADWLRIHGANCYGVDKVTYSERIKWIYNNESSILGVPDGDDFWETADDPWQFLAFCFEYAEFKKQGFGFITHLPTSVDGSNNGLQILSLMMRDRDGATSTNVCEVESPEDIYNDVASYINDRIISDFDNLSKSLQNILNVLVITRSTVKKQTMTLAYSSTRSSCRDYTRDALRESLADLHIKLTPEESKELDFYISDLVWEAINARLTKATELMKWFQDAAYVLVNSDKTVAWKTPLGFKVEHNYKNQKASTIDLLLPSRRVRVMDYKDLDTVNKRKNSTSISPNIVHSLDAAALQLTVLYAHKCGVKNFQCIHDSFGTLCTNMDELSASIRSAYHKIFAEDVPAKLKADWESTGVTLPPLPEYGDMTPSELLDADYFFC